jgi:uncharacterized protein (DUF1800 family)
MADSPSMTAAAIALARFGLGARQDDVPPADPKAWLFAQFDVYQPLPPAWAAQPGSLALAQQYGEQQMQVRAAADQSAKRDAQKALRENAVGAYRAAVNARVDSALTTSTPFIERLVHFWANHFAISTEKPPVAAFAGAFEAEAIRPHVLGRFEDMLIAVERHPTMQVFLDQVRSVGPDSPAALRADTLMASAASESLRLDPQRTALALFGHAGPASGFRLMSGLVKAG